MSAKYRNALLETLTTLYTVDGIIQGKFQQEDAEAFQEFLLTESADTPDEELALHVCQKGLNILTQYKDMYISYQKLLQRNDEMAAWLLKDSKGLH